MAGGGGRENGGKSRNGGGANGGGNGRVGDARVVVTLSKYRDFNHLSANYANISKENFGKFYSVDKLLIKESEKILSAKCSKYFVSNTIKNGHDLLTGDIEAFIMKHFVSFCFLKM